MLIHFNEDFTLAIVNATVSNLSSAFTGAHIHLGSPGENGAVLVPLTEDYFNGRLTSTIIDIDKQLGKNEKFKNSFDVVVLCEVFEHLPHPYLALHKINYCLKEGGVLIMTYPNPFSLRILLKYLFQKDIFPLISF